MLKRALSLALCLLLTLMIPVLARADVSATPNQRLAFRTGPNTKYTWLFHMPQSTALTAIEYESGNGVTWVLVEFWNNGKLDRGYTGLKRMTVNGSIPWADHLWEGMNLIEGGEVYSGPGPEYVSRSSLKAGDYVSVLRYEGDFAFIEFTDPVEQEPARGWVFTSCLFEEEDPWYSPVPSPGSDGVWYSEGTLVYVSASRSVPMFEHPYAGAQILCWVPSGSVLSSYATTGTGHLYVEYGGYFGYVDKASLSLY